MKKLIFILITVLMAALAARADVTINATNFPDANFRNYLLSEYPSGTITTAQLNARTELVVESKYIYDAKGVEYFTQLTKLDFYDNKLTSIDVSALTKLTYLNLGKNQLYSINVNNNTLLQELYLQSNYLTSVYVVNHSALKTLWANNNLNLKSLTCYSNALTNLDVYNCTAMTNLNCNSNPNLSYINNLGSCTAITYLDCEDCKMGDLSAVMSMPNLESLYARNNNLSSLDVSGLRKLKNLRVSENQELTELKCNGCVLQYLNVWGCSALKQLSCNDNYDLSAISGLDECPALENLSCYCCALTSLDDLQGLQYLRVVVCSANNLASLSLNNMPSLVQLWVDDNSQLTSLECAYNDELVSLNVTGCSQLSWLTCESNPSLTEITGLSDCTALTFLDCMRCQISSLDIAHHTNLEELWCQYNNLTSLDVSSCTSLELISAHSNQIASMNVSNCPNLKTMSIYYNQLKSNAMGNLIAGLPTRRGDTGKAYVFVDPNPNTGATDGNVITDALINQASAKHWDLYHYNWSSSSWVPYTGAAAAEAYACYTSSNTTLTFYYDNQRSSRPGTTYDLNSGSNDPGWYTDGTYSNVTKVVFNSSFASARPTTTYYWFGDMAKLQSITGTQYFNTSQVTNMCLMFAGTGAMMPNLDANFLNTSKVKTMESMFANSEFTSIIVSDWNTSEVTNMLEMFAFCYNLTDLDLSNWNTSKVTTMEGMFNEDYILVSLDLSNFNTSNVTNMNNMFHECNALTSVDLSSFNTANVTTMYSMFDYCTSLTSLDLSSFNTSKVTDMRWMFSSCSELTTIYAGNGWSTAATTDSNSDGMFRECTKIRGGQGTTYNASHTNRLYARIDGGTSNPGYFTAKNAGLRGDVNGDGSVNISDVTALIDLLLGGSTISNPAADCNQDGSVNISDVTALIDYLLSNHW